MKVFSRKSYIMALLSTLLICACQKDEDPLVISDSNLNIFSFESNNNAPNVLNAIENTLKIWEQYLDTNIPIRVKIVFLPSLGGLLGQSIPNGTKNFPNAPVQDVWYPTALANTLSNQRLNSNQFDMEILITADVNWYFGTDGNPEVGQYDFVSVFLHEVCHSLGFGSLAGIDNHLGSFGTVNFGTYTPSFPVPDLEGKPSIYDVFIANTSGFLLTDTSIFADNSEILKNALTNNDLFFSGADAINSNQGQQPRLFAPTTFIAGSSISHLDNGLYPIGDSNGLMEPFFDPQEVIHSPGPVILGVLRDLGWSILP